MTTILGILTKHMDSMSSADLNELDNLLEAAPKNVEIKVELAESKESNASNTSNTSNTSNASKELEHSTTCQIDRVPEVVLSRVFSFFYRLLVCWHHVIA